MVWIKFDNPKVGEKRRKKYRHLYTSEVQTDWTPIMKVSHNFYVKRGSTLTYFDRTQFPISLACAITTNKGQGDTYDSLECDFRARPVCKHLVYTALSRVKILAKLYIIEEFDAKRISVNEDVSYCVFPCLTILLKLRSVYLFMHFLVFLSVKVKNALEIMQKDKSFPLLTQVALHSFHFFFQNVQSLKKHFDVAIKQPFVSSSCSVFFCET